MKVCILLSVLLLVCTYAAPPLAGTAGRPIDVLNRQIVVNCAPGRAVTRLPLGEVADELATGGKRDKRQISMGHSNFVVLCGGSARQFQKPDDVRTGPLRG